MEGEFKGTLMLIDWVASRRNKTEFTTRDGRYFLL